MLPYFIGAATMLIGVVAGHVMTKPWLDRRFNVVKKPVEVKP